MHNRYFKPTVILIIVTLLFVIMTGLTFDQETATVRQLLKQRVNIIEKMLDNTISYEEGRQRLKEVETDKQYSDDLKIVEEYEDSDYDKVIRMKVADIEKSNHVSDLSTYIVTINWTLHGYDGVYNKQIDYYIGIKECETGDKIVSMELFER